MVIMQHFDSFGVDSISKEITNSQEAKMSHQIFTYRIQAYDSIMRGCLCIGFIDFMLNNKSLTDFTN